MIVRAPAKLNLCLYLGPVREDGLHEIVSLFEPIGLADELEVTEAGADEVVCEGLEEPDLTARALAALRRRGWRGPGLRIEVRKRIPVAAGLGGGSADAAAVLRLARGELDGIEAIAAALGADVPSQLEPAPALVGGAGERIEPIEPPADHVTVLIPQRRGLSTAAVYAEADRLGAGRPASELEGIAARLREAVRGGRSPLAYRELLVNDLEPAALSLRPEIERALAVLHEAGASHVMVTGSGPTAVGLFERSGDGSPEGLGRIHPDAIVAAAPAPLPGAGR